MCSTSSESERLLDLVHRKQQLDEDVVRLRKGKQAKVVDLMQVLQEALRRQGRTNQGDHRTREHSETLFSLSEAELYEQAKALDIPGRSSMSKQQLTNAISQHAALNVELRPGQFRRCLRRRLS